jgi:hypothetical protein
VIALVENNPRALQSNSAAVLRRFSDGNVPLNGRRKARPTIEELREYLDYQPETGVLRWRKSPSRNVKVGDLAGGLSSDGYKRLMLRRTYFQAHRVAFALHHGRWPEPQCDHANCVKTDNRAVNLRECTHSANQHNKPGPGNKTGVKGVRRYGSSYQAHVELRGVKHTKRFRHLEDAAAWVKQTREQLHGEFARH